MSMKVEGIFDPIERFENFIKSYRTEDGTYKYRIMLQKLSLTGSKSLVIDFDDLLRFDPELAKKTLENPEEFIESASRAIKNVMLIEDPDYAKKIESFYPRFKNLPEKISLRQIRSHHIGQLVAIDGIITRASEVKPQLIEAVFECQRCHEKIVVLQEEGKYTPPIQCTNPTCRRKGPFKLIVEESKFIDWQKIRVQERPEDLPPGQLPRFIDAYLKDDLVDIARPGDRVTVIGILKTAPEFGQRGRKTATFRVFIETNYVELTEKEAERLEITPEEEQKILELAKDQWIHKKIIRSIAPSIYGYDDVKEAIALLLFGGVPKTLPDGMRIRGEPNILLVGDPGTAKSQLLRYVARIAPRGIYTSGKGSTAAGLTAAVIRDPETGGMSLEAGALVLSDRGVACIDEFDKMNPQDRVAIHEAMEQQTISIAKAGIVATLNARTAILAAANPKLGRYDPYRPPVDNINLPPTILSRFDLIFILTDRPRVEVDKQVAEHILALHQMRTVEPPIPPDLLRKYIAYARKNVHPVLTPEAAKRIEQFYLELRSIGEAPTSPVPITARQLEALIRLAEAHARMALRNKVTAEDAEEAIRLMKLSLQQVGIDSETGQLDIDLIMTGHSKSQRDKMEKILDLIDELGEDVDKAVPVSKLIERANVEGIDEEFVKRAIERMKKEGIIFEPRPGFVKKA